MIQTRWTTDALSARVPGVDLQIVELSTRGDRIRDVPLGPTLGQSFFTKEIEDALLRGRIDLAVHSCKDLATNLPPGLALGAVPAREDPRDALVSRGPGLRDLPAGARVGTSSMRRKAFLAHARPDLVIEEQRGNVPTRVSAVDEGRVDAVILAAAGLRRLGMAERITEVLEPDVMLPAASQGALAIQVRSDDRGTLEIVSALDDPAARGEVTAERACLRALGAGCQAPLGALARASDGVLSLQVASVAPHGIVRTRVEGSWAQAEELGAAAARALLDELGLDTLRDAPWARPPPRETD